MALADTLQSYEVNTRKMSEFCAYQELFNRLPIDDQKALTQAWQKNYPVNVIVKALRSEGHKTSSDAIRAHKNGLCRCPKK